MSRVVRAFAWLVVLGLVVVPALIVVHGCGADPARRTAHVAIVSAGSVLVEVHAAHQASYTAATDALRTRLRGADASLADYDHEVREIDAAFADRSAAIQALTAALYAAAAIIDATRAGAPRDAYAAAARDVLAALDRALGVLARGDPLPAVAVPPALTQLTATLRALAAPEVSRGPRDD